MSRVEAVVQQIDQTRRYTLRLLDHTPEADWHRFPAEGVTTVAWQAGHIAYAEYRLAIVRIRGERPKDADLISPEQLQQFGPLSPTTPGLKQRSPEELRALLARIHERALHELASLPDEELDQATVKPHPEFSTKLGSLLWCVRHEMLHAGQIGLLRRLLGHAPLW